MIKARLITIGTEIVTGEVVNSNAAWVSTQLESLGVRVFSHLSIRDQRDEILRALKSVDDEKIMIVTGGLGPTSDDITRDCMAKHFGVELDYDESVFKILAETHVGRGLPVREAHKHQCYFPRGSERLMNPVGTALGFAHEFEGRHFFVLPGPPRELEGMWKQEVEPRLLKILPRTNFRWRRWTCLGSPESEVAEVVEAALDGMDLEVGYRAAVPYVKVKVYVDPAQTEHVRRVDAISKALAPFIVAEEETDLAQELLELWPEKTLNILDTLTENYLVTRVLLAKKQLGERSPKVTFTLGPAADIAYDLKLSAVNGQLRVELPKLTIDERFTLPFKTVLESDRGRRSAADWGLWFCVRKLRAKSSQRST